jgi:ribosomal protein S10
MYGTNSGIDPYTRTVSDVYQDIFGEGSLSAKAFMILTHSRLLLMDISPKIRSSVMILLKDVTPDRD